MDFRMAKAIWRGRLDEMNCSGVIASVCSKLSFLAAVFLD